MSTVLGIGEKRRTCKEQYLQLGGLDTLVVPALDLLQ